MEFSWVGVTTYLVKKTLSGSNKGYENLDGVRVLVVNLLRGTLPPNHTGVLVTLPPKIVDDPSEKRHKELEKKLNGFQILPTIFSLRFEILDETSLIFCKKIHDIIIFKEFN